MSQYQPAPAGEIEVEIVAASIGEVAWKASDDNPRGECLRLRLSAGRAYSFVFVDVPLDWTSMLRKVRAAAGVSADESAPERLVGRRVRVELKQYAARNGTTRATVARWLGPATEPPTPTLTDAINAWAATPPARQPASKPSRNAVPRYVADDDIPF